MAGPMCCAGCSLRTPGASAGESGVPCQVFQQQPVRPSLGVEMGVGAGCEDSPSAGLRRVSAAGEELILWHAELAGQETQRFELQEDFAGTTTPLGGHGRSGSVQRANE